jgi:periplasmic protein TonB
MSKVTILSLVASILILTCNSVAEDASPKGRAHNEATVGQSDSSDAFVDVDEMPVILKQQQPKYPESARVAGLEGSVWLKLHVSIAGLIDSVVVTKHIPGQEDLEKAAVEAAKTWEFKPASKNGRPVEIWAAIQVKFKLTAGNK